MSITKERKAELIKEYGDSDTDSGSPAVQVAILTGADSVSDRSYENT